MDRNIAVETEQAVFTGHIGDISGSPAKGRHRGNDDNHTALILLQKLGQAIFGRQIDSAIVDIMGLVPDFFRQLMQIEVLGMKLDTGIRYDNVQLAKPLDGLSYSGFNLAGLGYIGENCQSWIALSL